MAKLSGMRNLSQRKMWKTILQPKVHGIQCNVVRNLHLNIEFTLSQSKKKKGKGNAFWNTAHVGLPYLALVESIFIESGKMNFTRRLFLLRCHHVCYLLNP